MKVLLKYGKDAKEEDAKEEDAGEEAMDLLRAQTAYRARKSQPQISWKVSLKRRW
jgi:hypothetical protein